MNSRTILLVLFTILLAGVIGAWVAYYTVTRPFPQTEGTLVVPGLSAPVTIRRNAEGVPLITASTTEDLFFAQGFVHAQDRLFQMDVQRRAEQGIEGGVRRTGLITRALRHLTEADPQIPAILEAYSRGVNAYVATTPALPIEYQGLGMEWEAWVPEDSLVIVELYGQAVRRAEIYQRTWRLANSQDTPHPYSLVQSLSLSPATLVNPWYINRLESPNYQATGVSLMGVPFIVTGQDAEGAWTWNSVQRCPDMLEATPFLQGTTPSPTEQAWCELDLVSWFIKAMRYNGNALVPILPARTDAVSAIWVDSRVSVSPSVSMETFFGKAQPYTMKSLPITDESAVAAWIAALNSVPSDNIIIQRAQEQLEAWNGEMRPDLPGATLYRVVRAFMIKETFADEMGAEKVAWILQEVPANLLDELLEPDYPDLWDDIRTPDIESREDIIARAWEQAHDYLGRRFGDVPHEWAWGRLHYATFRHPLADRFPILDRLLTRTVPLAGDASTLIPIPEDVTNDFKPLAIPSLRVVLSPGGDFYFAYPGGQSAHPFHPNSNTFLEAWATGDLVKLEWNGADEAVLELVNGN